MTILVTGGAGYIGSHTCRALAAAGHEPVVLDDLSNGHAEFVRWGPLERGDVRDPRFVRDVLARHRPRAIVHFAALIEVGRSMKEPLDYFDVNVAGTLNLLREAQEAGCDAFVLSSTCATYGDPERLPLDENHPQAPINPYGRSKLVVEQILRALDAADRMRFVALRYFNAAGAAADGSIGERHDPETHAVPLVIDAALGRRDGFTVFGTDYDTPDGTCIRDYVHVEDLADAHVRAVDHLLGGGTSEALNLGTGTGTSVRELCACVGRHAGRDVALREAPRRAGDAPVLVADATRAREVLGWTPRHDIGSIVATALRWHTRDEDEAARRGSERSAA